jgi:hypothetical protein
MHTVCITLVKHNSEVVWYGVHGVMPHMRKLALTKCGSRIRIARERTTEPDKTNTETVHITEVISPCLLVATSHHQGTSVNAHAYSSGCGGIAASLAHLMDLNKPVGNGRDVLVPCLSKLLGLLDGTHILHCRWAPMMGYHGSTAFKGPLKTC